MPVVADSQRHGPEPENFLSSTSSSSSAHPFSPSTRTSPPTNAFLLASLLFIALGLFIRRIGPLFSPKSKVALGPTAKDGSPIVRRNLLRPEAGTETKTHQYPSEKDTTSLRLDQEIYISEEEREISPLAPFPPATTVTQDRVPFGTDTTSEEISFAMLNPLAPSFIPSSGSGSRTDSSHKPALQLQSSSYTSTSFSDTDQNPDYTLSSSPISFVPTSAPSPIPFVDDLDLQGQGPRRRSYNRLTTDGVPVAGEIVVAEGWRRHTKVFGGGVCLACIENERRASA
ncbi:hypothetical protein BP6252_08150 [Coleophoma cylindrospora]|uniref:Uncharacterized protein n=1 Tax=Coleophoma cylindrospora TaxID=1849047 RepID=A0A3D8RC04_9HELO|nr:hypothetical protein BP6252_08150 [Coleophoma cylindrospora]